MKKTEKLKKFGMAGFEIGGNLGASIGVGYGMAALGMTPIPILGASFAVAGLFGFGLSKYQQYKKKSNLEKKRKKIFENFNEEGYFEGDEVLIKDVLNIT